MTTEYSGPLGKPGPKPVKNIERVTTSEAIQKEKSVGRKFKDTFFGGDAKLAIQYAIGDVIFPGLRNLLFDSVTKSLEKLVFGDSFRRPPIDYRPRTSYTPYGAPYASRPQPFTVVPDSRRRGAFLPDQNPYRQSRKDSVDIILGTREDADVVVERMMDCVDKYDSVSYAEVCELIGKPSSPIDHKWGWTYLPLVQIRQVREGYLIDLPPMEAL